MSAPARRCGAGRPSDVGVVGHGALGSERIDGQILRTRLVIDELRERLGVERVRVVDTGSMRTRGLRIAYELLRTGATCRDLIVMPNTRGLRAFLPLYAHWARRGRLRVHYLVVGGWLPRVVQERPGTVAALQHFRGVYVQTNRMVHALERVGLRNVYLLPNFRRFARERPRSQGCGEPMRFVFLSRVIPEKGVAHAIEAVRRVNELKGSQVATLDLWGPVSAGERGWLETLIEEAGASVRYRGVMAPESVSTALTGYDMMLFPTYWSGEAFPGVVLDAMIAGIPVIASDWQDNAEIIEHGQNGLLFPTGDVDALTQQVQWCCERPDEVVRMKRDSAHRADAFHVDAIIPQLLASLGLTGVDGA